MKHSVRSFRYLQSCPESSQQPCFFKCGNEVSERLNNCHFTQLVSEAVGNATEVSDPIVPFSRTPSLLPAFISKFIGCILCSRRCSACKGRHLHLSLMSFGSPMKMKEPVTVGAQISTHVAQNDGCGFSIIVVVTHRLK